MAEIVNGAGINKANAHVSKHHSKFPLKEPFMDTHRFGEYHPHFVFDAWESERHPVRCVADTRSYTLKAPLMQDITMNKDYFMVNMRAILPLQAERIRTNPTLGDDVPADAYTSVPAFISKVKRYIDSFNQLITNSSPSGSSPDTNLYYTTFLKKLILTESIFSRGSLLASLGCNLSSCLTVIQPNSGSPIYEDIDTVVDNVGLAISALVSAGTLQVLIDGTTYYVAVDPKPDNVNYTKYISVREFLMKIRDTSDWLITAIVGNLAVSQYIGATFDFKTIGNFPVDLARVWAYHLVVYEYFSNDKVDYIYSADLFRQYIRSLFSLSGGAPGSSSGFPFFTWNGLNLTYDVLSFYIFDIFSSRDFSSSTDSSRKAHLQYFLTLFGYHRSLRFKDYFTGSRTRPLAVIGNAASGVSTDVPVVNNQVNVIDVTRSIQAQRFMNAVNASGRKFGEWINSFFGVTPNKDMHEPIFLAHSSDKIFAADNENTGDAVYVDTGGEETSKNSVTAIFRGRSNDFEYSVDVKEPCIIIGITSYDIERVYRDTIHRDFFIRDRYDMFNPMMQYIGDQAVYAHELFAGDGRSFGTAFGYQFRDMQWKLSYPRCAGAFGTNKLPGYSFVYINPSQPTVISPDFIRSKCVELDEFYLSLTSYSLGNYFHFIMRQLNVDNASRPMIAQPQIL